MDDLINLSSRIIEGLSPNPEEFTEKTIEFLVNDEAETLPIEIDENIFHALRIVCRDPKKAETITKNEKVFNILISLSGFAQPDQFSFPEASKCLLNILHQIDEARLRYVKSENYEQSLDAFKTINPGNPDLFFRLRHLFICTIESEGAEKVLSEKLVPHIYQIALSLLEDFLGNKSEISELISIFYNISTFDKDHSNAPLYMQFCGKILDQESGKDHQDLLKLKANTLNIFLNLSYECLQQPVGIGNSFRLEKLMKFLEEIFQLPKEDRTKITMPGLYLVLLNLCDSHEEVRKALRKYILPSKWDRHVKPENGSSIKSNLIRSMRSSNSIEARSAGNLILSLCNGQVNRLIYHIGYGNAAGFLYENHLLEKIDESQKPIDCVGTRHRQHLSSDEEDMLQNNLDGINLITGEEHVDIPIENEMTEDEKIQETELVLEAMEKLEKLGFIKIFKQ